MIAIELNNDTEPTFLPQFAALAQLQGVDVNSICHDMNVEPISSYLNRHNFGAGEGEDESTWYSAKDGAKTFSALSAHVSQGLNGRQGIDIEQLTRELDDVCKLLAEAVRANLRFHLIIVIIPPGLEGLVGN